jgi:hypothetical protein
MSRGASMTHLYCSNIDVIGNSFCMINADFELIIHSKDMGML